MKNSPVFFESFETTVTKVKADTPFRRTFGLSGCARNNTFPSGSVKRPNVPSSRSISALTPFFFRSATVPFRSFVRNPMPVIPPIILSRAS